MSLAHGNRSLVCVAVAFFANERPLWLIGRGFALQGVVALLARMFRLERQKVLRYLCKQLTDPADADLARDCMESCW